MPLTWLGAGIIGIMSIIAIIAVVLARKRQVNAPTRKAARCSKHGAELSPDAEFYTDCGANIKKAKEHGDMREM